MADYFLTDTHAHIHNDEYERSIEEIINISYNNGVKRIITVGTDYEDSLKAVEASMKYPYIYAVCGLHPEYADDYNDEVYEKFYNIAKNEKVLAIGETGLDYYHNSGINKSKQQELFYTMMDIALSLKKPVVIHSREAAEDTVKLLDEKLGHGKGFGGIFHCFDGSLNMLDWALENNFYVSYSGNLTFKSAENIRTAFNKTPLDRVLVETDSPYLAPVPLRGKPNMPAYVVHTAEFAAKLKDIEINEFADILEENLKNLFGKLEINNG